MSENAWCESSSTGAEQQPGSTVNHDAYEHYCIFAAQIINVMPMERSVGQDEGIDVRCCWLSLQRNTANSSLFHNYSGGFPSPSIYY
jgi:hypothetical protein